MEDILKFWRNIEGRVKDMLPIQVFPAVVKEVDEDLRTCTVRVNDNVDFDDVRLYAVVDDSLKGFCLVPAVDSTVLVGRIANGNELCVVSFSVVDKVLGTIGDKVEIAIDKESLSYKCDKTEMAVKSNDIQVKTEGVTFTVSDKKVTIDADEVVFNGGKKGVPNVDTVKKNLDAIKSFVESMHTAIDLGLKGVLAGTAASGTLGAEAYGAAMKTAKPISLDDMEDEKVKH